MPKTNDFGLLERHAEKVILLAAAAFLVLVVVFWVLSSPARIELTPPAGVRTAKKAYLPGEVNLALREIAQQVEKKLKESTPSGEPVKDYRRILREEFLQPVPVQQFQDIVQWRPGGPKLVPPRPVETPKAELAKLRPLLAPEKPVVAARQEMVTIPVTAPDGTVVDEPRELVGAHVAAVYDHGKLLEKWHGALKVTGLRAWFVVLAVEAERRQRLPDGRWSAPTPVSMVRVPAKAPFEPLPRYDGENYEDVAAAIGTLAQLGNQEWLLAPDYYPVYQQRQLIDWRMYKPRTRVSDMGDVPHAPVGAPALLPRPEVPYRGVPRGTGTVRRGYDGGRTGGVRLHPLDPRRTRPTGSGYDGGRTRREVPRPTGTRPPVRREPRPIQPRTPLVVPTPVTPTPAHEQPGMDARVLPLREQLAHPKGLLELWFHDASLAEAVTYSYRVRLVLVSPLFGQFKDVKKQDDAKVLSLPTPWSEWSDGVVVNRPTQFFLAGVFPSSDRVSIKVFTRRWGQWVAERFTVRRGQPIGGDVRKKLIRLDGRVEETTVSFVTGAVAVDFDFDRKVRLARLNIFRRTTEMLYLDAEGKLRARTMLADEADEGRKELEKQVR